MHKNSILFLNSEKEIVVSGRCKQGDTNPTNPVLVYKIPSLKDLRVFLVA
jgi:uncharacterized protein YciI